MMSTIRVSWVSQLQISIMATPKSIVTDTELNLLKALWEEAPLTAREIAARVYGEATISSIGTVQKLISRLEEKRMLSRDSSCSPHSFTPLLDREEIAGLQLAAFADKLSGGSLSPFVLHLVRSRKLTRKEKKEIRQLLAE